MEVGMKIPKFAVLAFALAVVLAAGAVGAQSVKKPSITQSVTQVEPDLEVIAGPDVGFRVGRYTKDGVPVGELVVKKDGKWVAVEFGAKMKMVK